MLGKRPRPPMKRTTSMSVIGSGCANDDPQRSDSTDSPQKAIPGGVCYETRAVACGHMPSHGMDFVSPQANPPRQAPGPAASWLGDGSEAFTPMGLPGSSMGCSVPSTLEPAHFLEACHLCKRRLGDGQDIYMYRGDTAFCSVECRQQQIAMDERKEKSSVTGMKKVPASSANHHDNSSNFQARPGTVAAA